MIRKQGLPGSWERLDHGTLCRSSINDRPDARLGFVYEAPWIGTPIVIPIWSDAEYGLITRQQMRHFERPSHIDFRNPDFVQYAESFGAKGYRVDSAAALVRTLKQALADDTFAIIDCPVDYAENTTLTARLEAMRSPR